jgi:hypothetical protein
VTLAYAVTMLGLYFTVMHGDRSRWAEAAALLKQHVRVDSLPRPSIHASEPSIVASYLGVPAGETLSSSLVTNVSSKTVSLLPRAEVRWYLIDAAATSPELQSWLNTHAARVATFEARTGPRDRTVWVYRVDGRAVQ